MGIDMFDPAYQYLCSMHWAISQLQGSTDIVPGSSHGERVMAILTIAVSVGLLAKFVSALTNLTMQLHALSNRYSLLLKISAYLNKHEIPGELRTRVKRCVEGTQRGHMLRE